MATARPILGACLALGAWCAIACTPAQAVTTGWDSYRRIDQLPMLRTGEQARLASSYDRRGGNRDGGSYACLRRLGRRCVIAEHDGPGEIASIWSTRPRAGSVAATGTIRVELDGRTVLDDSLADVAAGRLGGPFRFPAVADARRASGAVFIRVPMPFRERMLITTSNNPRYARVTYRTFDSADGVPAFDPGETARGALSEELLPDPPVDDAAGRGGLDAGGPGVIARLRVTLGRRTTLAALRDTRVDMTFDGRRTVSAPLGQLFGSGLPARVSSLLAGQDRDGLLNLRWPMPFLRSARIRLRGAPNAIVEAVVSRAPALTDALARGEAGYFRATSRRGRTARGRPWRIMEANRRGLLVGLSATLRGPRSQRHLEGDETIVADGRALRGTGTEDFFEGGYYWYFGTRTHALVGSPAHLVRRGGCREDCRSMYRWMVADAIPFQRSLRFTLEHGDRNRVAGIYSTTALWYAP